MRAWKASGSSPGRTRVLAFTPCLRALNLERSLPSGVLGPWLFWPLMRLASACFAVVVMAVGSLPATGSSDAVAYSPGEIGHCGVAGNVRQLIMAGAQAREGGETRFSEP